MARAPSVTLLHVTCDASLQPLGDAVGAAAGSKGGQEAAAPLKAHHNHGGRASTDEAAAAAAAATNEQVPSGGSAGHVRGGHVPYVGVDVVPGRSRWPYRAMLSLSWGDGAASGSRGACSAAACSCTVENYYSSAEAAARAVDTTLMVLLGEDAAINFPPSAYATSDLDDAARFLKHIAGGALPGCGCGCKAVAL
jgi:hypothetical protein